MQKNREIPVLLILLTKQLNKVHIMPQLCTGFMLAAVVGGSEPTLEYIYTGIVPVLQKERKITLRKCSPGELTVRDGWVSKSGIL